MMMTVVSLKEKLDFKKLNSDFFSKSQFKLSILVVLFSAFQTVNVGWAQNINPLAEGPQDAGVVSSETPKELEGVKITEKLGSKIDPNLAFLDENGNRKTLGDYLAEGKPLIVSPVYYSCPGLCNFHLNGLTDAMKMMDWSIGNQFSVLSISFDSRENPKLASSKKDSYLKVYDRPEASKGWHFLTTDKETIQKFTDSVGFAFRWNEEEKQWSHGSAAIVINPEGTITRYLPGIIFEAKDIRMALNESVQGKVGTFVDNLVLYCFKYNPHQGKYTIAVFNIIKIGGFITMLILMIWLIPFWFRRRNDGPTVRSAT